MGVRQDLKGALGQGLGQGVGVWVSVMLGYSVLALVIGFVGNIFHFQLIDFEKWWFLPLTLLVFPSFFEELLFRGVLLRRDLLQQGWSESARGVILSSLVFVLWHPINALTINQAAQRFFLDPFFLIIVFLLGLATGIGYLVSRSLWVPVLMHWSTVLIWVMFLGGRNLVLES